MTENPFGVAITRAGNIGRGPMVAMLAFALIALVSPTVFAVEGHEPMEAPLINMPKEGMAGYWPLCGDCKDYSGNRNHGKAHGVDMNAQGPTGKSGAAASFNGVDNFIEVPNSDSLRFGRDSFSLAVWVSTEVDIVGVIGDIVSKFDANKRRGFNLCIKGSSPCYTSHGDAKNVHFGIDNGIPGTWEDAGRPWPTATYVGPMAAYNGELYAGIGDAVGDGTEACHVFRYAGQTKWVDCGRVGNSLRTRGVRSLIVHKGELYASTGSYDYMSYNTETCDFARVYRYGGGTEWIDCGQPGADFNIQSLASYAGDLYAGTASPIAHQRPGSNRIHRYADNQKWIDCGRLGEMDTGRYMMVYHGNLYAGSSQNVYQYEGGQHWKCIGRPNGNAHTLEVYRGKLYAGTWREGVISRYDGDTVWTQCGHVGLPLVPGKRSYNEVQGLTVYNGKLYAGAIPAAEVFRYEGGETWTRLRRFSTSLAFTPTDRDTWVRAPVLTVFRGKMYAASSWNRGLAHPNPPQELGHVYAFSAGAALSSDRNLGSGWKHLVAVRDNDQLRLYVNGQLIAESDEFQSDLYDLSTEEPLLIGFGCMDYFSGKMCDLRIYNRSLTLEQIMALGSRRCEAAGEQAQSND